jgi:hypothetical protein
VEQRGFLSRTNGGWLADVLRDGYSGQYASSPGCDMGWRTASYDLSAFKGKIVRLVFENHNRHGAIRWISGPMWTMCAS